MISVMQLQPQVMRTCDAHFAMLMKELAPYTTSFLHFSNLFESNQ